MTNNVSLGSLQLKPQRNRARQGSVKIKLIEGLLKHTAGCSGPTVKLDVVTRYVWFFQLSILCVL